MMIDEMEPIRTILNTDAPGWFRSNVGEHAIILSPTAHCPRRLAAAQAQPLSVLRWQNPVRCFPQPSSSSSLSVGCNGTEVRNKAI